MQLRIDVRLESYNDRNSSGNFQLSETVEIREATFIEVAQILARFHELGEVIGKERADAVPQDTQWQVQDT